MTASAGATHSITREKPRHEWTRSLFGIFGNVSVVVFTTNRQRGGLFAPLASQKWRPVSAVRLSCCASSFLRVSEGLGDRKIRVVVVRGQFMARQPHSWPHSAGSASGAKWPVRWSGCRVSVVLDRGSGVCCGFS